jgi:hypothetical protein
MNRIITALQRAARSTTLISRGEYASQKIYQGILVGGRHMFPPTFDSVQPNTYTIAKTHFETLAITAGPVGTRKAKGYAFALVGGMRVLMGELRILNNRYTV